MTNDSIQVIDYDTKNTLMLNRRTIISATKVMMMPPEGGKYLPRIKVRCYSNIVYTLDMEPTVENLKYIMP